jgi:GT2 family glycosyltransferase/glycosyltransferase involved in cell wall biosynthesis
VTAQSWGTTWKQRLRLVPLYLALLAARRFPAAKPPAWRPPSTPGTGITIVVPERDTPEMLGVTLDALHWALPGIAEPTQVVVVVNGAARGRYDALRTRFPAVEFLHSDAPLGFGGAVARGLDAARHPWTYLLNSDMRLAPDALATLLPWRAPDVFALASQVFQCGPDGRREETGFVDWFVDASGIRAFHAEPRAAPAPYPSLCASGGAALFRTEPLRRYVGDARCYDPFYWEDADWGVRAWRDGMRVLFCPTSHAQHLHRATTSRFYAPDELERIVERNRLLFDARHAASGVAATALMQRVCALPYASQRELATLGTARAVFSARRRAWSAALPLAPLRLRQEAPRGIELNGASYACRFRAAASGGSARPRVLLVTPFAVFPPRHGGARRVAGLLRSLVDEYDVMLISDEAGLYDARSLAPMDGLYAAHLVERGRDAGPTASDLGARMAAHCHPRLAAAVADALTRFRPAIVQVEHVELAPLVARRGIGERWVLGLHDAVAEADFADASARQQFFGTTLAAYDAVTVCSDEDAALTPHRRVVGVPNGSSVALGDYQPSVAGEILFVGPFRYTPNLEGIRQFLADAWPAIRAARPGTRLTVLGGDESKAIVAADPLLRQQDVEVLGHREDVPQLLRRATLTVNPLRGIRGSAVKVIESLSAGRICVSTRDGARGFAERGSTALVTVADVASMATPIVALLGDDAVRHAREAPDPVLLEPYQWDRCAERQRQLYRSLLATTP